MTRQKSAFQTIYISTNSDPAAFAIGERLEEKTDFNVHALSELADTAQLVISGDRLTVSKVSRIVQNLRQEGLLSSSDIIKLTNVSHSGMRV